MNESLRKSFFYLGVIAALYVFFSYILPWIFKALGFAFKALFFVIMWVAIALVIVLLVAQVIKMIKKD